jgi:hypothetical protein
VQNLKGWKGKVYEEGGVKCVCAVGRGKICAEGIGSERCMDSGISERGDMSRNKKSRTKDDKGECWEYVVKESDVKDVCTQAELMKWGDRKGRK